MQYYIRQLPDERALLIAEDGYPLSRFDSVDDAVATCIVECRVVPLWIEWYDNGAIQSIDGDCVHYALNRHFRGRVSRGSLREAVCS